MRRLLLPAMILATFLPAMPVPATALPPGGGPLAVRRVLPRLSGAVPAARFPGPALMLPKWRVVPAAAPVPLADAYADYRTDHPEVFAVTVPPTGTGVSGVAEWAPMSTMLLANPGGLPASVQQSITDMIRGSIAVIDFDVIVSSDAVAQDMRSDLLAAGVAQGTIDARVRFLTYAPDSVWMADFGPLPIVRDGTMAFADFRYYPDRVTDDAFPTLLGHYWDITTYRAPLDFEGGNFATDGEGTCYVSQGLYWYNADKTAARIDELLGQYLGCRKVIVLAPLEDGTTHIDMFSKLASKNVMVLGKATTAEATQATLDTLALDADILEAAVLADGSRLTVHRIPMPYQRDEVWRTYTNATFANGINLVPTYAAHAARQAEAMAVWAQAMPDWTHVAVESGEIITWGGAMHCISRTLPEATRVAWVPDGTCAGGTCGGVAGGYAGPCDGDEDCRGPALACLLNECDPAAGCGGVTYEGCCDDGDMLRFCEDGALQGVPCENGCGWSNQGYYDCGGRGADPSGTHPLACPDACVPDCADRECGTDGCGGLCGACAAGDCSPDGRCVVVVPDPAPDAVEPDAGVPDAGVADPGAADPGPGDPDAAAVDPGPTDPGSAVPDGVAPDGCVPDCAGGRCGDDGCGGRCPACPSGYVCGESSFCIRHVDDRDIPGGDAVAGDAAPEPVGKGSGGCAALSAPGREPREFPGFLPWLLAPLLFVLVYNTRRV